MIRGCVVMRRYPIITDHAKPMCSVPFHVEDHHDQARSW